MSTQGDIPTRFREMRRRHIGASVALLVSVPVILFLAVLASVSTLPLVAALCIGYVLFVLIGALYARSTWLCPQCGHHLGHGLILPGWDITHCRYCGVRLQ